MSVLSIARQS